MGVSTHIQGTSKHRGAPYDWMPPVHTQHKESMLCQTKGVSICPHTFGCPHKFGYPICLNAPCMLGCPHMFGWPPLYLDAPNMPLCMFEHPHMFGCPCMLGYHLCLDAPCMLGYPHMFRCPICLDDVWVPPVHTQHKESMLCQTKGDVHMRPYIWMCPVCLDATICLDALHMFGCPTVCLDAAKCMVASKGMRDIQTYEGCPNIQGHLNIWGYPNI